MRAERDIDREGYTYTQRWRWQTSQCSWRNTRRRRRRKKRLDAKVHTTNYYVIVFACVSLSGILFVVTAATATVDAGPSSFSGTGGGGIVVHTLARIHWTRTYIGVGHNRCELITLDILWNRAIAIKRNKNTKKNNNIYLYIYDGIGYRCDSHHILHLVCPWLTISCAWTNENALNSIDSWCLMCVTTHWHSAPDAEIFIVPSPSSQPPATHTLAHTH